MKPFTYERMTDLPVLSRELDAPDRPKIIAGGTNLVDLMKERVMNPDRLLDITRLPLDGIHEHEGGGIRLGALAKNAETAAHPLVLSRYPLLSRAILAGASAQIRNMASNGGNLMQRTRCFYFYDTATPCNKREPGSGCGALGGFNRIHAILGASDHCIATHPSDMCVALAALEAEIVVSGRAGERRIPFADFHTLPGNTPHIDNSLRQDEVILAIDLPPQGYPRHHSYLKIRDRRSYAFALVSVAAAMEITEGVVTVARLALGGVAAKPWRDQAAEKLLTGSAPDRERFHAAADLLLKDARGYGFNDFKIELARRVIVRALHEASGLPITEP